MKKQFTTQFAMMFMAFAFSFVLAGCGEDITSGTEGGGGGIDTTKIDTTKMTVFSADASSTRTSVDNNALFYWETGDRIWVDENKNNSFSLYSNKIELSSNKRSANFIFRQKILDNGPYNLTYTGNGSSSGRFVTIKSAQTQDVENNSAHIGTDGDCGVAEAIQQTNGTYTFKLEHKAHYLVFQPYKDAVITDGWKLMGIEIIDLDGKSVCGTYPIRPSGLETSNVTNPSDTVKLTCGTTGYTIPTSATDSWYAVIQPGTHSLRIRYKIKPTGSANGLAGGTFLLTKDLVLDRPYNANTVTIIMHKLDVRTYSTNVYYMFDAAAGQYYWRGVADPPTFFGGSNSNYPKDANDPRWWNTSLVGRTPGQATRSCRDLPNVNLMSWYAMHGDPRWDEGTPWCFDNTTNHICSYGVWILKKQYIMENEGVTAAYMNSTSSDRTIDARTHTVYTEPLTPIRFQNASYSYRLGGRPSYVEEGKYFFLPTMGRVQYGVPMETAQNIYGRYWTSSISPVTGSTDAPLAFQLMYNRETIRIEAGGIMYRGRPAVPTWFQ